MKMTGLLYNSPASKIAAIENCRTSGNIEEIARHTAAILYLVERYMQADAGIEHGTCIDFSNSNQNHIVFDTRFDHTPEGSYSACWTRHKVIVTPALVCDFDIRITGRDRNGVKEDLREMFDEALRTVVTRPAECAAYGEPNDYDVA
jgi:hypothetical protein